MIERRGLSHQEILGQRRKKVIQRTLDGFANHPDEKVKRLWGGVHDDTHSAVLTATSLALAAETPAELRLLVGKEVKRHQKTRSVILGTQSDIVKLRQYKESNPEFTPIDNPDRAEEGAVARHLILRLNDTIQPTGEAVSAKNFAAMQSTAAIDTAQLIIAAQGQLSGSHQNLKARMLAIQYLTQKAMEINTVPAQESPRKSSKDAAAAVSGIDAALEANESLFLPPTS